MTSFIEYLDLNREKREIRLLQLLPRPGAQYERLPSCRLLYTSLEKTTGYKALSYVWGDPEPNRVIKLDDAYIRVPRNLFDALIALRPFEKPLLLWVDYLCINQVDNTEKAWQVALMRDIYSKADEVLAWLGPGDKDSQRAIEYLDELGREAYDCGFYHDIHAGDDLWQGLAMSCSSNSGELALDAIRNISISPKTIEPLFFVSNWVSRLEYYLRHICLFDKVNGWNEREDRFPVREMVKTLERPWFARVWILQEITLSKKTTFICGTAEIDRKRLAAAINTYGCLWRVVMIMYRTRRLKMYHRQMLSSSFLFRATTMVNSPRILAMEDFPLIALLRLTCVGSPNLEKHGPHHLDSTDPRDKIFALLGLATDREDLAQRGLIPDYTKSCREIYTLATLAMLQEGHVSVLSLLQPHHTSPHKDLPSWVPDWYQPFTEPLQIVENDHMTLNPEFNASGTKKPSSVRKLIIHDSHTYGITLEVYVCDEILHVGFFPKRRNSWDVPLVETYSWPQEWLTEILRLTYLASAKFPSFEDRLLSVARTSIGGLRMNTNHEQVRTGWDIFPEVVHLLRRSIHRIKGKNMQDEARQFLAGVEAGNTFDKENVKRGYLPNDITGRSLKRLPFISKAKRLGLGYDNVRPGDVIAIMKGAQVPYILRPLQNGTYNLVSEAYVDGIMDGEAVQDANFTRIDIV